MCQCLTCPQLSLTCSDPSHHPHFVSDKHFVAQCPGRCRQQRSVTSSLTRLMPLLVSSLKRQDHRTVTGVTGTSQPAYCGRHRAVSPTRTVIATGHQAVLMLSQSHGSGDRSAGWPARPVSGVKCQAGTPAQATERWRACSPPLRPPREPAAATEGDTGGAVIVT